MGLIQLSVLQVSEWLCVCGAQVSGCMSVYNERCLARKIAPPVLLCWPFLLMRGSWQSRGKCCVSVCTQERRWGQESVSEHHFFCPFHQVDWLFSCYSVMINGKHLPESAPGFFGLRAECPCECSLCACLQQFHECISVWQMWQIFHGSHKSAHISLISGAHRLLSLLITRKGKQNATHDWTYMCTHDIHKMQNTRKQMNKA